jgi:hypothetical protein
MAKKHSAKFIEQIGENDKLPAEHLLVALHQALNSALGF